MGTRNVTGHAEAGAFWDYHFRSLILIESKREGGSGSDRSRMKLRSSGTGKEKDASSNRDSDHMHRCHEPELFG